MSANAESYSIEERNEFLFALWKEWQRLDQRSEIEKDTKEK